MFDGAFEGAHAVYGIPEHASSFALKSTANAEPYRLYNLDVFQYEIDNTMALYGSVPFMTGHSREATVGVFWLNAAEMFIDVEPEEVPPVSLSALGVLLFASGQQP